MTGGIHISKDIRRVWISAKEVLSPKNVMRDTFSGYLAKAGLILDFIGDYEAVIVSEEGSKSLSELIGRMGISLGAAVATTIISDILLSFSIILISSSSIPVIITLFLSASVVIGVSYLISKGSESVKSIIWSKE